jgi:hypothetical protein
VSDAQVDVVSTSGPHGPWKGTVRIEALHLTRGRHTASPRDVEFRVTAEWTGPPAFGFPPSPDPVQASDTYVVYGDLELARAVALMTVEALRAGGDEAPDMRDFARHLKGRLAAGGYG